MMSKSLAVAALSLGLFAGPLVAPASAATAPVAAASPSTTKKAPAKPTAAQQKLARTLMAQARTSGLAKKLQALSQTVEDGQQTCSSTELDAWTAKHMAGWNVLDQQMVGMFGQLPIVDALLHTDNQVYGPNGVDSKVLKRTSKQLQGFWDVQRPGFVMAPMHSEVMSSPARLSAAMTALGTNKTIAKVMGAGLAVYFSADRFEQGASPLFSFNAVSIDGGSATLNGKPVRNSIVMGDGLLRAYRELGYGDVAPQAVLAHEYGHQVQFSLGLMDGEATVASVERTELMADAFSGYFLTHAKGQNIVDARVQELSKVFYAIGDCQVDVVGHHGTPVQRRASFAWSQVAAQTDGQRISPSTEFVTRFDSALPSIQAAPTTELRKRLAQLGLRR